jgi:hypothetical protein
MREFRSIRGRQPIPADWREPKPAGDRRWTVRSCVILNAQFRPRWQRALCIRVENLSARGCGITGSGSLIPGSYSWITLPTLESRYAQVAWCDGNAAGLDFADPLHKSVADMIIERAATTSLRR